MIQHDDAYYRDIAKNLVKRVMERQKVDRMLHPPRKKRTPRPSTTRAYAINWMHYRLVGTGDKLRLLYALPNGSEVKHTVVMPRRECHRVAVMLSRELRNSPVLMSELLTTTSSGDKSDGTKQL